MQHAIGNPGVRRAGHGARVTAIVSAIATAIAIVGTVGAVGAVMGGAGCGARAPVWYEAGTRWTIPMVAPLDNAEIVVPVTLHEKGPYLFVLAPDVEVSLIDRDVARELDLYSRPNSWRKFLEADDRLVNRRPYEVLRMRAGDLSVRKTVMWSAKPGSLAFRGQRIHGVIGADLLTRTIVVTIDRDRGVVDLALTGHERAPERATRIAGRVQKRVSAGESRPAIRKIVVPARLGQGRQVELVVDLAARRSQLWPELGSGTAALGLDGLVIDGVVFARYGDRRVRSTDVDGVLGQDVLSRYRVTFDPDDRELWLGPRDGDLAPRIVERLRRWGTAFTSCATPGCVTAHAAETSAGRQLVVARAPGAPTEAFEVVLQAVDGAGVPLAAPLVRATLNRGETVAALIPPALGSLAGAAQFRVVDASLHVPPCPRGQCVAALNERPLSAPGAVNP